MMAEGIGRGDAVFLPAFTYTATAEVPLVLGATPVFVDVDPRTFQIDPAHLAAAHRRRSAAAGKLRPRALIGVDLFGQPADWPALSAIAQREGLFTLDDLRAELRRHACMARKLGSQARRHRDSASSRRKPLGAYGDGGALFTESDERAALYRSLRTHGEGTTRYEVLRTGMNGRLDTHAGGGAAGEADGVRRGAGGARADRARSTTSGWATRVTTPARVPDSTSAWAIYAVLLRDGAAARPGAGGAARGRACRPRSTIRGRCIGSRPIAAQHDGAALPVSEDLAERILALPIHPDLTEADADADLRRGGAGAGIGQLRRVRDVFAG